MRRFVLLLTAFVFVQIVLVAVIFWIPNKAMYGHALREACIKGDLKFVTNNLKKFGDTEYPDENGRTLLTLAAQEGHAAIVKYLLYNGANINGINQRGRIPLQQACCYNRTEAAIALIEAGADCNNPRDGWTALTYAGWHGNILLIDTLLEHHANINAQGDGASPLIWAVKNRQPKAAEHLILKGADVNMTGNEPEVAQELTPLIYAAQNDDVEMMKLLVKHGVDVNSVAPKGVTALMASGAKGSIKAMEYLLACGAKIDTQAQNGATALHTAAGQSVNQPKAVDWLITHGANPNLIDKDGETPLMWAADCQNLDNMRMLIRAGADINLARRDGQTALMQVCDRCDISLNVIKELVEAGADIDRVDLKGETALNYAGNRGWIYVVEYLKGKGAKRTDLHIILRELNPTPLPPAKAWALAVGAIYFQVNGRKHNFLGGCTPVEKSNRNISWRCRNSLKETWKIKNKADLIHQLDALKKSGHRADFLMLAQVVAYWPESIFQNFLDRDVKNTTVRGKLLALRGCFRKWGWRTGLAFDLCRYINLASDGYAAGYLTEDEAWKLMMPVARQTQESFESWQELGQNFLDSRYIWAGEREQDFEECYKLLANPEDVNSPWNQNPWNTDLSK